MYSEYPACHTTTINDSMGTVLHVAVDMNKEDVVEKLVDKIISRQQTMKIKALVVGNQRGDTPLHVAATRGFAKICKIIIGKENERKYLVSERNKNGETPLFQAALNWQKQAYAYLSSVWNQYDNKPFRDLVREDQDTILHCAIRSEYFDLAIIIMHYYGFQKKESGDSGDYYDFGGLSTHLNKAGFTPLKVLATRPSAFKSGSKLSWWERILYNCILVEPPLDAEREMKVNLEEMDKPTKSDEVNYPENYATLYDFFAGSLSVAAALIGKMSWKKNELDTENPPLNSQVGLLPPNYETFQHFVRSAFVFTLGLSGVVDIKKLKKTKERHQWGCQLLKELMKTPVQAYIGDWFKPPGIEIDQGVLQAYSEHIQAYTGGGGEPHNAKDPRKQENPWPGSQGPMSQGEISHSNEEEEQNPKADGKIETLSDIRDKPLERKPKADDKTVTVSDIRDTSVLVAARNGIVEMVNEILSEIPNVIYETNSQEENVLLVAVRNKKPLVVENLKKKFEKEKPEVWNTLTMAVDKNGKTMLHKAAYASQDYKPWQISGSALQMMWDVNWFQYIKRLAPEHFHLRSDNFNRTASELFKEEHNHLRKESGDWLRETSESCSVVAALVAGVSFATAATIPGGNDDNGMPHLEDKPAFDAFVIASLIGLCFSVTGLIMFLTILTSRKLHTEFRRDLPLKLLLGLSSLFVSIAALLVSFCTSHSFLFSHKYKMVIFPIYVSTCFPVTFYAVAQLPLYFDLLTAILFKVPTTSSEGDIL